MQIRKNRSAILLIVYILFAVYCFVFGESGILERMKLLNQNTVIKERINAASLENKKLGNELAVISSNQTNKNFYKQEAAKSGYIAPGEKYIFFQSSKEDNKKDNIQPKENRYPIEISHLRILWIAVSGIILFFYFMNVKRKKDKESKEGFGT